MSSMPSKLELLSPTCNPSTLWDGRGGIFTWLPPDPIVEFNLIYYNPGSMRGLHYHPEFVEYLLIIDGAGGLISSEEDEMPTDHDSVTPLSKGVCVRLPSGTRHTVYAITPMSGIAMLTRRWDDCAVPAVRVGEIPGLVPQS